MKKRETERRGNRWKKKGRERKRTRHTHTYQKPWVPTNLFLQNQTSEDRPLLLLLLYFFGCVFCFFFLDEVDVKWYDSDCGCWEICLFIGFDFFGLYSFTLFFLINNNHNNRNNINNNINYNNYNVMYNDDLNRNCLINS